MELRQRVKDGTFNLTEPNVLNMKVLEQLIDINSITQNSNNVIHQQKTLF